MKKLLSVLLSVLSWVWQLPQHLIALVILGMNNKEEITVKYICGIKVYFVKNGVFNCGVSLGNYIILYNVYRYFTYVELMNTVKHEKGHSKQSKYFGWFYLLIVGLPSVCNNVWDRLFHKKWDNKKREQWYYSRYPEKWADKLGGVNRWVIT